ncbi:MAG: PAS domain S-box protein [Polyangiaceae bacterium]|nr:PAS domain S-box protein [Polyangiaceae bacterium]
MAEVVRNLPLGAAVFDRDMRYLAHNSRWVTEVHGVAENRNLVGRVHYEVFPEISEEWRQIHQRCLAGATERNDQDTFQRADGGREQVRWVAAPWREDGGTIGGIVIYAENITHQVETQMRLREGEGLLRDLFEQSSLGLNLCTMDGLWLKSNPAFLDIIGYSRREADGGLTYWQLTPRKFDGEEQRQLESLRANKRYGPYEKEFIRKDGRLVPVRLNGFIVERDGVPCIWSLIEDLTQQRALEAQVEEERRNSVHASKLAMVGEMAAGIAHELNNPLTIIGGHAYALRESLAEGNTEEAAEALLAIEEATARAGKIVHGLRKFSRHGGGDSREALDPGRLVADAILFMAARIRDVGVAVERENQGTRRIWGHPIELSQVVVNLLSNACDAVAHAEDRWVHVSSSDEPEGFVTITVSDSGPGIPKEIADRVFSPFFTTKVAGEGTGLGLSISRSIVEHHGGTLTYEAEAPTTRFVLKLPAARA